MVPRSRSTTKPGVPTGTRNCDARRCGSASWSVTAITMKKSAKASMTGFARSLAKELGRDDVRVNVLAPGFVETEMTSGVSERARAKITGDLVLRRFGTPQEIAAAAVFLTEDATYCTGTVLTVDGGWSL